MKTAYFNLDTNFVPNLKVGFRLLESEKIDSVQIKFNNEVRFTIRETTLGKYIVHSSQNANDIVYHTKEEIYFFLGSYLERMADFYNKGMYPVNIHVSFKIEREGNK